MKREVRTLLGKAIDSLILSVDHFNRLWDKGRVEASLMFMDHAFEMFLKAAIIHRGGKIREKRAKQTIGFDACVRKALSDASMRFLAEEQALTLQTINSLRDAAQHHYLEISEEHLYLHAQSGLSLFKHLLQSVFGQSLADELPARVLPIATKVPTDFAVLFEREVDEVKKLLAPRVRRKTRALARLRSLAIVDNALGGERLQPSEADLRKLERRIRSGENWDSLFPAVAGIQIVANGHGPSLSLRIAKKEGIPVTIVPEGTPGAAVLAVRRVNELDYYNLNCTQLAENVGLTQNKTVAVIWHLKLKGNPEYHKEIPIGKVRFHRYSQKAIEQIKATLTKKSIDSIWSEYREALKARKR